MRNGKNDALARKRPAVRLLDITDTREHRNSPLMHIDTKWWLVDSRRALRHPCPVCPLPQTENAPRNRKRDNTALIPKISKRRHVFDAWLARPGEISVLLCKIYILSRHTYGRHCRDTNTTDPVTFGRSCRICTPRRLQQNTFCRINNPRRCFSLPTTVL